MRVRAKICGLCSAADAAAAEAAGADFAGVILTAGFARSRTDDEARTIYAASALPRVGVFVNEPMSVVADAALRLALSVVQLHGAESVREVSALRSLVGGPSAPPELWKVVRVAAPTEVRAAVDQWSGVADAVLLDGWSGAAYGGSGASFDWQAVAQALRGMPRRVQLVVAGGLTPDNVSGVVRLLEPDVVDVSSGVEAGIGRKSPTRMRAFIAAVSAAAAARTP